VAHTWPIPVLRSGVLAGLWLAGGRVSPVWIIYLPWVVWLGEVTGRCWPRLARQPEWVWGQRLSHVIERGMLWAALGLALGHVRHTLGSESVSGPLERLGWDVTGWPVWGLGCVVCGQDTPSAAIEATAEGEYRVTLCGHFTLAVAQGDPFRKRMLMIFLRQLQVPDERRASRRTRDGRTPFVRQQWLAQALGVPHPDLSRWERYWQTGDWRRLLSQRAGDVLTLELQQQIITTWAHWPQWNAREVHAFLVQQGATVTRSQVEQAARDSGWQIVRSELGRLCVQRGEGLRLREGWLIGELLAQNELLLTRLASGQGLTPEERLEVATLRAASSATGLAARASIPAKPWLRRVEWMLFGPWEALEDDSIRCTYCDSSQVGRKSSQPRVKRFLDEHGQKQTVAVYRYYCHNPACDKGSFTALPPGLVPYSRHRLEVHALAVQGYAWSRSTYRRVADGLGITTQTCYRWVSAFGHDLLPVAALFGVVKSSGVVGVDEKWVKVPKNDKPVGKMRKWMYVYLAVDVYTYDLLHIAVYPENTAYSTRAFLLALRAKGYRPRVIVTDLRREYGPAIGEIFPSAEHHVCIFHALKGVHRQVRDIYGTDKAKTDPAVVAWRQAIDDIFDTRTKRTAQRRYEAVLALRDKYVAGKPEVAAVFDSLEEHWPKLVNAIESDLIPTTNNAVELVIRRFDQHYQK